MASIPSIAMIPSGYKATKVYSVLPTDAGADLTFARASVANRVASNGLIEEMATDVPRLDYSDGGCPSLLLEPQSTNLFDYSEDLSLWNDGLVGLSISADSTISPDGSLNADLVTEDTSTGSHVIRKTTGPTITSGLDYSFSFFVKSNGRDIVALSNNAGTASATAFLNLTSGSVLSSTFDSISMEDYGNDWWRITTTLEATGTGDYDARIYTSIADGSFSHTGDGTSGLYIWGLQIEEQSYATSYIPTSGATATRIAETCSKSGLGSYINSSEGVLYAEMSALANDGTDRAISVSDGTLNNGIQMYYFATSNRIRFRVYGGGGLQGTIDAILGDVLTFKKVAISWDSSSASVFVDGTEYGTPITITTSPTGMDRVNFDLGQGSSDFYGKVKDLRVYDTALTDAELTALTTI